MLRQRIITALIIAPIAIACVFFLPLPGFSIFIGFMITVSAWEWANLADLSSPLRFVYAGFIALLLGLAWNCRECSFGTLWGRGFVQHSYSLFALGVEFVGVLLFGRARGPWLRQDSRHWLTGLRVAVARCRDPSRVRHERFVSPFGVGIFGLCRRRCGVARRSR